jgi:predicted aspartyl protease
LVVIEGQIGDDLKPQNFVLDTGTTPSIINERIVRRLGLPTHSAALAAVGKIVETHSAIIPQLQLGPIRAMSLRVQVKNLSQLEHDFGIPIAGIVGMDVLARANFHLDYSKRQIEFGEVLKEGIPVPFDARAGIAIAEVTLEGKPVRMLVDTGSDQVLVLGGNFADPQLLGLHVTSGHGASVAESKMTVQEFAARDIQLAGQHFSREKAYFLAGPENPGFDGLLGVRALGFHGISFDQERNTLYLQK